MVRKRKRCYIRSARKKEGKRYVQKQLSKMSSEEIRKYFDIVEPIDDDEVDEVVDRIYPKLTNAIESIEKSKIACRHTWSKRRIIAVAACLTLMVPVVAQALGLPLWETFISWTSEHLHVDITQQQDVNGKLEHQGFSEQERQTWGDGVCETLEGIGAYPALPTWKPEGYLPFDVTHMDDTDGYAYITALYHNEKNEALTLTLEIFPSDAYTYGTSVEYDEEHSKEFVVNGTQYYLVSNLNTNTAIWRHENVVYQLGGPLSFDTLEKVIRSIQYN